MTLQNSSATVAHSKYLHVMILLRKILENHDRSPLQIFYWRYLELLSKARTQSKHVQVPPDLDDQPK